jgi:glutathione S-transferase
MKLYYRPGACSLCPHIVLRETGAPFELERVDRDTRVTDRGIDFTTVNPLGYVPVLLTDDGRMFRETAVIIQVVADMFPALHLLPAKDDPQRYAVQEWLTFISSELHKGSGQVTHKRAPDAWRDIARETLRGRLAFVAGQLEGKQYLAGGNTVADAYLFTTLCWTKNAGITIGDWPALRGFYDRMMERPAVSEAMAVEKLTPV